MTRADVEKNVVAALREIQNLSAREDDVIGPETRPVGDLKDFDSLNGEEATVLLESAMGCDLPGNVFVAEDHRRALRVREVVDQLCRKLVIE